MKRFLTLFSKENSFRGASVILAITFAISNVLGLFRNRFLAQNISYTDLDMYYAAFRVPDTLFNFLVLGAVTTAFIPVFSEFIVKKNKEEADHVASSMINVSALIMVVVAVSFFFLMPSIIKVVVPAFEGERLRHTITTSRIMMLTPVFFSVSYVLNGVLNSHKRFLAPALAPLIYNVSIILGALFVAPKYGVIGVSYFVALGAFLHMLVQIPAVMSVGFRYHVSMDWRNAAIGRIIKLMVPRSLSLGANQVLLTVYTAIGSTLPAGSISAYNQSNDIQTVPLVIFAHSLASAIFPMLSHEVARDNTDLLVYKLRKITRFLAFLLLPSTVFFILLRAQIVRLIIGTGKVTWEDTRVTALTLAYFALSFFAQGLVQVIIRFFFAAKDTKIPMCSSIIMGAVSITLAYPCSEVLGVAGLALAYSIGVTFQLMFLVIVFTKRFGSVLDSPTVVAIIKYACASLAAGHGLPCIS